MSTNNFNTVPTKNLKVTSISKVRLKLCYAQIQLNCDHEPARQPTQASSQRFCVYNVEEISDDQATSMDSSRPITCKFCLLLCPCTSQTLASNFLLQSSKNMHKPSRRASPCTSFSGLNMLYMTFYNRQNQSQLLIKCENNTDVSGWSFFFF